MTSPEDFGAYARLADELIGKVTKDQLADVARLLAINIGCYHEYEDVPQETLIKMVRVDTLDEESMGLLLHGMQNLVSAPAEVMGVEGDEVHWAAWSQRQRDRVIVRSRP
jgi:hypothetical protein